MGLNLAFIHTSELSGPPIDYPHVPIENQNRSKSAVVAERRSAYLRREEGSASVAGGQVCSWATKMGMRFNAIQRPLRMLLR